MRFPTVSVRVLRSVSAWALPRPSAIASAKFAKITVNQSQNATWPVKSGPFPVVRSCTKMSVVTRLPTSTMNITGFLICVRGSSFRTESRIACRTMAGSHIEILCACSDMVAS